VLSIPGTGHIEAKCIPEHDEVLFEPARKSNASCFRTSRSGTLSSLPITGGLVQKVYSAAIRGS